MAVDTETPQEQETTAQEAVAETTTQEQETSPELTAEATQETQETAATAEETPAAIPGQSGTAKRGWDPAKQQRDQEEARRRKEEETARIAREAALEVLKQAGVNAQQQQHLDEITQAEQLESEYDRLDAEADKLVANADFEAAGQKRAEARQKLRQAGTLRSTHARKLEEVATATTKQQQAQSAHRAALMQYAEQGGLRTDDFLSAYDKAYQQASGLGYSGVALDLRVNEIMQPQLSSLKKSATPAPKPNQQPAKKTATKAGASTPPGAKVTPSGSGVRPSAMQRGDAGDILLRTLNRQ